MGIAEYEISWTHDVQHLARIVKLAKDIERIACKFYSALGNSSDDKQMAAFWNDMAEEERTHMEFWGKTLELAEKGVLPQIFESPDEIVHELQSVQKKANEFLSQAESLSSKPEKALLAAFRLEFYNIHSVLVPLLKFVKPILGGPCPYDNYDAHLARFIDMYNTQKGSAEPEMELLGEIIQKLWKDNLRLAQQSYLDELTGIFNRRGFANAAIPLINLAQRNVETVAFMIADIDHFKVVNDTYGHQTGDLVLKYVVGAMRSTLRGSDIIARYGGEEFMVLCPVLEDGSLQMIAERIRAGVESSIFDSCKVTISIGAVDAIPPIGMNSNEVIALLCSHADQLLLRAKGNGRNRVEFQTHEFTH